MSGRELNPQEWTVGTYGPDDNGGREIYPHVGLQGLRSWLSRGGRVLEGHKKVLKPSCRSRPHERPVEVQSQLVRDERKVEAFCRDREFIW